VATCNKDSVTAISVDHTVPHLDLTAYITLPNAEIVVSDLSPLHGGARTEVTVEEDAEIRVENSRPFDLRKTPRTRIGSRPDVDPVEFRDDLVIDNLYTGIVLHFDS